MTRPLRRRISLTTVAVASLMAVFVLAVSLTLTVRAALNETYTLQVVQARVLASNLTAALAFADENASRDVLGTLVNASDTVWARIVMPKGRIFAEYRNRSPDYAESFAGPDPQRAFDQGGGIDTIREPIVWQGDELGTLEVWIDNKASYELGQTVLLIAIAAVLSGALLTYFLSLRLGALLLRPVGRLTDLMGDISSREDYSQRFHGSDISEIQTLGESFNVLLSVVEDRDGSLNRVISQLEEARDEAQNAADSKTLFLANMSHEIRTPMNGILGIVSLLKETHLDARQQKYFATLESSATGLLVVIDDILDFTKLEAGQLKIREAPFSVSETLSTIQTFFEVPARDKGLDFSVSVNPDVVDWVKGDPARIRQVLLNLVGNAIKFTEQGGVELRVESLSTGVEQRVRFSVSDTGIGIPEEKQAGIFSAFFQADFTSTREYGGTGLGLAICRQLAGLMGGDISFRSFTGEGSYFWLDIPLPADVVNPFRAITKKPAPRTLTLNPFEAAAQKSQSGERFPPPVSPALERYDPAGGKASIYLRVLVAEDSEVNQFIIKELLATLGITPQIVSNGEEAVGMFRKESFDLIFMDIQMPVLDGLQATQQIRDLQEREGINTDCHIVGLSAHAMAGDREKSLAVGMDEYMTKPIDRDRLASYFREMTNTAPDQHLWR